MEIQPALCFSKRPGCHQASHDSELSFINLFIHLTTLRVGRYNNPKRKNIVKDELSLETAWGFCDIRTNGKVCIRDMIWCQGRYCGQILDGFWETLLHNSCPLAAIFRSCPRNARTNVMSGSQHLLADKELALERSFVNTWFLSILPLKTSQPSAAHRGTSLAFLTTDSTRSPPHPFTTGWWPKKRHCGDSNLIHRWFIPSPKTPS